MGWYREVAPDSSDLTSQSSKRFGGFVCTTLAIWFAVKRCGEEEGPEEESARMSTNQIIPN